MTPFNLLSLDLLPSSAAHPPAKTWGLEATYSHANTFVMSDNVRSYLDQRIARDHVRRPLTESDVRAIQASGDDAYYVDGEFGLLDLTVHYALSEKWATSLTIPVYFLGGGGLDGTIEGFHTSTGWGDAGRNRVARNQFQVVSSLGGTRFEQLRAPFSSGLGDPVFGARRNWNLPDPRWSVTLEGAIKLPLAGARRFLSTGSVDGGLQVALQHRTARQGFYAGLGVVYMDGSVLDVDLGYRAVPSAMLAYEVALGRASTAVLQMDARRSTVRDTNIDEIKADKFQVTLGLRHRHGHLLGGVAFTENVANFENTPDFGVALTLAWVSGGG